MVLVVTFLALAAGSAHADPRDPFDFGPRRPGEETPRTPGDPAPRAPADDPTSRDIRDLARWPDRTGVRAAESLLLRGEEVIAPLCEVLVADQSPSQPGAAWVLGRVGQAVHVPVILRAAARRSNGSRAEIFFEASYDLDPKRTKDWLFSFLPLRRPVFRQKATDFLVRHVGPEDRDRVLRLLDAEKPQVRVSGLRLLDAAQVEDAADRLFEALADPTPEVSRAASVRLAVRADAEIIKRLNGLAIDGLPRERAYAALSLVDVVRARRQAVFDSGTLTQLAGRRGLLHPDRLPRGAAAVGLAFGAFDSKDPHLAPLLDRTVIDILLDTVGPSHFRDFESLREPVFAALRRLSGLDLPSTAIAWATWWQTERGRFKARRPLVQVTESDLRLAYVRFETVSVDGRRHQAAFRSEDGTHQAGEYALGRDAFKALVEAVEAAGVYDTADVESARADEHLLVTLGVMNKKRVMTVPAGDPRHPLLKIRMDSLEEANLWQRYRDTDQWPDVAAWWKTNAEMMRKADPQTRTVMLRAAIVYAWDDLADDRERAAALDRLEDLRRQDDEAGSLNTAEVRILVQAATTADAFGDLEARAVEQALSYDAAGEARPDIVEALANRTEPRARTLLSVLLAAGGAEEIRDAFADPRPGFRGAAARAAQQMIEDAHSRALDPDEVKAIQAALRPGLEVLAGDDDTRVAIRSVVALERLGDEDGIQRLEKIYKDGDVGARIAVADALGEMPSDAAWPFFSLILAEPESAGGGMLRAAALKGMGKSGHPKAVGLLIFYLLNDANRSVRIAAANALSEMDGDGARFALISALTEGQPDGRLRARLVDVLGRLSGDTVAEVMRSYLDDEDGTVADIAALRLADHNVAESVPYLVSILRGKVPAMAQAALRALENVSCVRFEVASHEVLAEQYERWHQDARLTSAGDPDRAWLRSALRTRGYDVGPLAGYVSGSADPKAVPVLIRALRDEDAVIRRGAGIALERVTGLSLGEVGRGTSRREASLVADEWARWWERVSGPSEDR